MKQLRRRVKAQFLSEMDWLCPVEADRADRAALSQPGKTPPDRTGYHAARSPCSSGLPIRPGHGRGVARHPLLRRFAGLDAAVEACPMRPRSSSFAICSNATGWPPRCSMRINALLGERGLILRHGTMVDATLVAAPTLDENSRANAIRR